MYFPKFSPQILVVQENNGFIYDNFRNNVSSK